MTEFVPDPEHPWSIRKIMAFMALTLIIAFIVCAELDSIAHASGSIVYETPEVDWSELWAKFRKHAYWSLEGNRGNGWEDANKYLTIIRDYPTENSCKITLNFEAPIDGDYRLTFAIDKHAAEYFHKDGSWNYTLVYDDYEINFDWSDVKEIPGLIIKHGIKNVDGEKWFWLRIRKDGVHKGAKVEIDPSIVATSTIYVAVPLGYQRAGFYAEGLFWAFYSDGTNAGWEFSNDGTTWTGAFTTIGACDYGYYFSIWFDGTYVHYARYDNFDLFYRRGTIVNDGTITWSADEQTVYDGSSGDAYLNPCICADTNGYAWIGARKDDPAPWDRPYVLKNDYNNGSWALDFAYELSAVDDTTWSVVPVPLTAGKIYVVYCRQGQPLLGNLWNGAAWVGEESDLTDHNMAYGYLVSVVADGDNVHFVYTKHPATYQMRHNERVWGVGWNAADVLVQDAVTIDTKPTLSVDPSIGDLYCFWTTTTDHVYYKKYDAGWDADPTDWIDESTDEIRYDSTLSAFYMDYGDYVGLLYVTKTASPYNVKFGFLTMPPIYSIENKVIDPSDSTVDDEQWFFLNASIEIKPDTSTFLFNRIDLDPTGLNISCNYTNSTDTFIEENDPNNHLQLDVAISVKTNINSTFVRLDYYVRIHPNVTKDGPYNVTAYSTASGDLSDEDVFTDVFTLTIRTPSAPTKLFGAGFNASSPYVELHWTNNLELVSFFEIQDSANGVDWDYLGQNATAAQYTDSTVSNGTERYYKVRTCRNTGVGWKNSTFTDVNFEKVYFTRTDFVLASTCVPLLFNASSIDIVVGTLTDGFLNSTYFVDGDWYNVSEINASPGLDVRFNFTGTEPGCGCIEIYHTYVGHSQHEVEVQVWNFTSTSWRQIGAILFNETLGWECSGLGHGYIHFFNEGEIWFRFYHEDIGHVVHELQVDRIDLRLAQAEACPITYVDVEPDYVPFISIAIILLLFGLMVGSRIGR